MAKLEILYAKMAAFALCASLAMAASVSDRSLNGGWKRESKIKTGVGERPLDRNLPACAQLLAPVFLRMAAAARQNAVFDCKAAPMRCVDDKQNVAQSKVKAARLERFMLTPKM